VTAFPVGIKYSVGAAVSLGLALLLGYDVVRAGDRMGLVFVAVMLTVSVYLARTIGARVEVDAEKVTLHRRLGAPVGVAYRQVDLVDQRRDHPLGGGIAVHYFPLTQDGLVDLERTATLDLPRVRDQERLLTLLEEHVAQWSRRSNP
jgi:hypothetical protein